MIFMKPLTPAAPPHFGHLGCSLLTARSSAFGWDAKWALTKSRALREILASADQPLRLLPSCFAILPGFAAWERLATIKECAESAREGGGLCPLLAPTRRMALWATEEATAFLHCWREGAILLSLRVLCPRTPHTFSPS